MNLVNCDIYRFLEIVKNKCFVCFGAGTALTRVADIYAELHFEEYVDYIVDNDKNKVGNRKKLVYKEIPVIDIDIMRKLKNIVVMITCADVYEVFCQLDGYLEFENVDCFVRDYVISATNIVDDEKRYYPKSYRITNQPVIPKKLHYCWFGGKPIPDRNLRWMESWKKYCPDYEIFRWDENNYDVTKNKYMYDAYKAKNWGIVPDYARLDIIYQYGGIYLDTDVELVSSLDELLYEYSFAGVTGNRMIGLGLGFGAVQGLQIIRELREIYNGVEFIKEEGAFNPVDASTIQKNFFDEKGYNSNGEYQIIDNMTIYPEKVLCAKCFYTDRILPTNHTIAIHHFDASWRADKMRMKQEIELFYEKCKELK